MCVVYGMGGPRHFEFAKAERGEQAPEGATVFAVCDGERVGERLDDQVFDAMTDGEYYELRSLVGEVRSCELIGHGCPYRAGMIHNLWRAARSH